MIAKKLRMTASIMAITGVILGQFFVGLTPALAKGDKDPKDNQGIPCSLSGAKKLATAGKLSLALTLKVKTDR